MKKGNIIEYDNKVISTRVLDNKKIIKINLPKPKKGVFIGWSYLAEGKIIDNSYYDEYVEIYLQETCRIKVAVIAPLTHKNRYIEPIRVIL